MRSALCCIFFEVVLAGAGSALPTQAQNLAPDANGEAIEWSVVDRFRLFGDLDGSPEARDRVDGLLSALAKAPAGAPLSDFYDPIFDTLAGEDAQPLRQSNWIWARRTGEPGTRAYKPGYLTPAVYRIQARLKSAPEGAVCRWRVEPTGVETPGACTENTTLALPAVQADGVRRGLGEIAVSVGDGPPVARASIVVEDELIVALGDSFISGEGNPDQRARFLDIAPTAAFSRLDWPATLDPGRVRTAVWWDEPCHRSLLSWPVLVALADAARHPRRATTFIHLGCSGAEAATGLYGLQTNLPGGGTESAPQFDQLKALIEAADGRHIDRVLLSIGGNDIGFVPVIEYAVTPPNGYHLGPLDFIPASVVGRFWKSDEGPIRPYRRDGLPLAALGGFREPAESRLEKLPVEYAEVETRLRDMGVDPSVVIQTTYPDILHDEAGEFCRTTLTDNDLGQLRRGGLFRAADEPQADREEAFRLRHPNSERGGFESLYGIVPSPLRHGRPWNFQFQYTPEREGGCDLVAERSDSEVCKAYWVWSQLNRRVEANRSPARWPVVSVHIEAVRNHGWCITPPEGAPVFPTLIFPRTVQDQTTGAWKWTPFDPRDFEPYDKNLGRWFRTANDSALTQYGGQNRFNQGTIHPTYNAHLRYAEAVLAEMAGQ